MYSIGKMLDYYSIAPRIPPGQEVGKRDVGKGGRLTLGALWFTCGSLGGHFEVTWESLGGTGGHFGLTYGHLNQFGGARWTLGCHFGFPCG